MDFDQHIAEIVAQTALFASHLDGADVTRSVPSCPDWNVSQLSRHVEGGLRWAREIVATRASEPPPDTVLRDLSEATHEDPKHLGESLRCAAAELMTTLQDAGPATQMWCPVPGDGRAAFYA